MNCCPDFGNGKILRQIDSVRNESMFNTNQKTPFSDIVAAELARSTSADIAVGYCGLTAVQQAKKALLKVAAKGRVRLVLGMYRIDGSLTNKLREELCELHRALTQIPARKNDGTGVYITTVDYHGKIWCFRQGVAQTVWVGSHNFSDEGLKKRLEAGTRITDQQDLAKIESFIDSLCGINCAVTIDKLAPAAEDVQSYKGLPKYTSLPAGKAASMEIKLRPSEQPQSSLNLCFGAGRKNQQGVYTPRPWYEIELSVPKSAQTNDVYPRPLPSEIPPGKKSLRKEFTAYLTHDGVTYRKASLSTYSDGNKAMGSKPRTIFGEFIKGGLESAGVLRRGEPITDEVLEAYGRDSVILTKLTNGEYVVTF